MRTILPAKYRLVPQVAKLAFKGQIYDTYQWEQQLYDGSYATFEMLKRPDTIQVLAIKGDKLVMLREEQPSMGPAFYGLPGGRHDQESETELDAAKREVLEETGMTFATWKLLDVEQPASKIEQFVYLYVASDFLTQSDQSLDAGEKIEIQLVDLQQAREIGNGSDKRHLPVELFEQVNTVEELAQLPTYGQA
jgi:ADP-ribose pyrophosphatase